MIADLSITPVGESPHTSATLAEILKAIDAHGISYQLTPMATCLEGTWEQIMEVTRIAHEIARRNHDHVLTQLRIEDDASDAKKLRHNIESVEAEAGRTFIDSPPDRTADFVAAGHRPGVA